MNFVQICTSCFLMEKLHEFYQFYVKIPKIGAECHVYNIIGLVLCHFDQTESNNRLLTQNALNFVGKT